MGRLVQSNTTVGVTQQYTEYFQTKPWGGTVQSFTVPAGVSQIKLTAVAVGGCLAGAATTQGMDGTSNNVIFARMNGIDPPFVAFSQDSSTFLKIGYTGKYINGSVTNSAAAGINGTGDVSSIGAGRMNGNYFNALDEKPWGIVISQANTNGTTNTISQTTDGFNFTHTTIVTNPTNAAILYSCVFGGNGQAMVSIGTATNGGGLFYTSNYGATWTRLLGAFSLGGPITRIRYLNSTWIACGGPSVIYTATPVSDVGAVNVWTVNNSGFGSSSKDFAWTGTTYVCAGGTGVSTQVLINATLSGTWTAQLHGGDLDFDTCESSPTGEVLLFRKNTGVTSATSVRATSGAATTYNSVNLYASTAGENICYDAVKYLPLTGGGMWAMIGGTYAYVYTTTSVVTAPSITKLAITVASVGNTLTNATAINSIQYLGSNYCHLGSTNGLGKYSAAGVITASLSTAAQLTTEFGYTNTTYWAPSVTVTKNGVNVMTLQGGGTANANSAAGAGGGGGYLSSTVNIGGRGPTGTGGSTGIAATGNGGVGNLGAGYCGGGGTWQFQSVAYAPMPNSLISGASGAYTNTSSISTGGGASLFSPAGISFQGGTFSNPYTIFSESQKVGQYGGGANGAQVLTTSYFGAGGGAQGCYQYGINVTPGDVITMTLPGCCYVMANGSTGTNGGPGGESYAMIQYSA